MIRLVTARSSWTAPPPHFDISIDQAHGSWVCPERGTSPAPGVAGWETGGQGPCREALGQGLWGATGWAQAHGMGFAPGLCMLGHT